MANTYPTGSNIRFTVEFTDPLTGGYVDPTTVQFRIITPETGQVVGDYTYPADVEVVKDSTGHYHANYVIDFPGEWPYQFIGAGAYVASNEFYVCARATAFPV